MVDEEVENILLEIRERVRAQEVPASEIADSATGNGDGESSLTSGVAVETSAAEALARIESHLATTSRAWDRLPPLLSNRSGSIARLELWVKRQIKRVTHWFTWEQINFNAAVHHALRDTFQALSDLEQASGEMKVQLEAQRQAQSDSERALEKLRAENEGQRTMLEQSHAELKAQRNHMNARQSELMEELRERDARMQEEQRVCFKQLSLEATEAAVLEDRARRKAETLLEELRRRVEQIEKSDE